MSNEEASEVSNLVDSEWTGSNTVKEPKGQGRRKTPATIFRKQRLTPELTAI